MKHSPARKAALKFLKQRSSAYQDQSLGGVSLPARERGLYMELVRGVVRSRVMLRAVLSAFCKRSLRHIDSSLLVILEIGVYQLLVLSRMPEFAAVASTMDLLPQGHRKQRGFVNGILRSVARSRRHVESCPAGFSRRFLVLESGQGVQFDCDVFPDPDSDRAAFLSAQYGIAPEALALFMDQLKEEKLVPYLESINSRPQFTLRITGVGESNTDDVIADLGDAVEVRDDGLLLWAGGGDPSSTEAHQAGRVVVQGSFAARVAPLVAPQSGERILDLCGAPGGKALHMAQMMPDCQVSVGVMDERGATRTRENVARCQSANITIEDVSQLGEALPPGPFDAILLDVPCSNTGVLNRRPFARHRLDRDAQKNLIQAQERILLRALRFGAEVEVPPRIIYSTCSILPDENERLVRRCVEKTSRYRLMQEIGSMAASAADDGGYAALLQLE